MRKSLQAYGLASVTPFYSDNDLLTSMFIFIIYGLVIFRTLSYDPVNTESTNPASGLKSSVYAGLTKTFHFNPLIVDSSGRE